MTKKALFVGLLPVTLLATPALSDPPSKATVVDVRVDDRGFHPQQVKATRGQAPKLRFTRKSDKGCATSVVFPELKIKRPLPLNKSVTIAVPTTKARSYAFQCGMGMYKSSVVIR